MDKKTLLQKAWEKRLKLLVKGRKLYVEGDKLYVEGRKLYVEGDKLWAEGDKLWAEGDKLFIEAVIEVHGNIKMEWKGGDCILENGEIYKAEEV
jgi:hypothetical protein